MAETATLTRPPTFMRYQRVEQVLESEPRFKAQMTSKSEAVLKPNGDKQLFSPVVIQVTEAIHQNGQDAHKAQKMDIIRVAMEFFRSGRPAPDGTERTQPPAAPIQREIAPPVSPAPTPAAATTKSKPRTAAIAPIAPAKRPAPAKQPAPAKNAAKASPAKPVAAKAPEPAANGQVVAPAANGAVKRDEVAASPEPPREVDGENARPTEGRRGQTSDPAYNPYISIFTQLLTALQLAENYDNQPGKDKRLKTLDDLAVEYRKFTGIPRNA